MTTQFHCFAIPGTFFLFNISHDRWNYGMICALYMCYARLISLKDIVMLATSVDSGIALSLSRPAQIAELPRSKFDPKLFPHSAYVEIFVTFATKVPYLTFCNKM